MDPHFLSRKEKIGQLGPDPFLVAVFDIRCFDTVFSQSKIPFAKKWVDQKSWLWFVSSCSRSHKGVTALLERSTGTELIKCAQITIASYILYS